MNPNHFILNISINRKIGKMRIYTSIFFPQLKVIRLEAFQAVMEKWKQRITTECSMFLDVIFWHKDRYAVILCKDISQVFLFLRILYVDPRPTHPSKFGFFLVGNFVKWNMPCSSVFSKNPFTGFRFADTYRQIHTNYKHLVLQSVDNTFVKMIYFANVDAVLDWSRGIRRSVDAFQRISRILDTGSLVLDVCSAVRGQFLPYPLITRTKHVLILNICVHQQVKITFIADAVIRQRKLAAFLRIPMTQFYSITHDFYSQCRINLGLVCKFNDGSFNSVHFLFRKIFLFNFY